MHEERWFTPGVGSVAAASFFSDAGHEIATSVLPAFLTSTLNAGPAALGAIEGVSDALVGVSKLAGGPIANDPDRRVKAAAGGYLTTGVATAAIGLATAVWQVAVLRALAWMSRGLRSPSRDMVLTSLTTPATYGRAFGLERAGDNAGAIVGPLLASVLVVAVGVREAILCAVIPGVLAALAILIAGREARRRLTAPGAGVRLALNLSQLRQAGFAGVLTPAVLFELGNVATTMLILRATDLLTTADRGLDAATSIAILMYAGHNAAAMLTSPAAGQLCDRLSPRKVLGAGAAIYVASYLLFAFDTGAVWLLVAGFVSAGIGIGLAETAESTMVAVALPDDIRGNGFGVLGLVQSFGDLGATVVVGLLWSLVSPTVAFIYAATWMVAAAVASYRKGRRVP